MKILVANKSDLLAKIKDEEEEAVDKSEFRGKYVDLEQGRQLAREFKMEFFSTSAETGENVEGMFEDVCSNVITKTQLKKEAAIKT